MKLKPPAQPDDHPFGGPNTCGHQSKWWHLLEGFESEEDAAAEDAKRLQAAWCVGISMFHCDDPACAIPVIAGLDEAELVGLIDSLDSPKPSGRAGSLASSVNMRQIRQHAIQAVFDAFEVYQDEDLAVATVIKRTAHLTPEQLMNVSAATLKNQFFTDLKRTGIAALPAPLVAFLHGEYEPTAGIFVLHWHVISTAEKAKALHRLKDLKGYTKTHTGADPIVVQPIADRVRQFSYLLKAFWSQNAVRDGIRDRRGGRIDEPYHMLYLAWLNGQQLRNITIMNEVWSARNGGTDLMRQLYLSVFGRPRTFHSKP